MDPLGSITAVFQLAEAAIHYLIDFKDASTACNKIIVEIGSINEVLSRIKSLADEVESGEIWSNGLKLLNSPDGPIAQFKKCLEQIVKRLQPVANSRKAGKAITWPFNKDEIKDMLSTIERQKTLFMLAMQNDHMQLDQAIRNDLQNGVRHLTNSVAQLQLNQKYQDIRARSQEEVDLLTWLSPLNFSTKQNSIFATRKGGTGEWFFSADLFQAWLDGTERILWCPGIPGAGKTTMASGIIDYLQKTVKKNTAIAYIYCDYKEQNQTAINFLGSLIQQLIVEQPSISSAITTAYRYHIRRRTYPPLATFSSLLQGEVKRYSKVFIIIDALDECSEKEGVRGILPEIQKIPNTHILVTSRYLPIMERKFEETPRLEVYAHKRDVRIYAEKRIKDEPLLVRHLQATPSLRDLILDTVASKANGMFLLAQLHLDSLAGLDNRKAIRKALEELPKGLDDTYDEAMNRIESQEHQKISRARQVLSWISYAARPLKVIELQHAMAIEPSKTSLDQEALPDEDFLVEACAGLVVVEQGSNIIKLVHYTTQQYLDRRRSNYFPTADVEIARSCLTYLMFDLFADGCCPSDEEMEESNISCATQVRYIPDYRFRGYTQHYPKKFSGLHIAASFGLKEIVRDLTVKGADADARNSNGMACLHSAAQSGHKEVVEFLLSNNVSIEAKDDNGMTPLHLASLNGQEAAAQILLDNGADFRAKAVTGETPLYCTAWRGQVDVAQLLLERGAEPNLGENQYGQTPLSRAALEGHDAVVKLLLHYGADPEIKETVYGGSPLSLAAERNRVNVVRLLLNENVDVNPRGIYDRTPLWYASRYGHEEVVHLLLERDDIDPTARDDVGQTPLMVAMERGEDAIVRLLSAATSEECATCLYPPLFKAVVNGDERVVLSLLEENSASLNASTSDGYTPLLMAAKTGRENIVKMLLGYDGIDLECKCRFGRTPLSWAAGYGYLAIVQLLLNSGAEVDSRSASGKTPLSWTVIGGHEAVVKLLLEQEGVDVNSKEDFCQII